MTDEEIIQIARKVRKEKYCSKFNGGLDYCTTQCEDNKCPLWYGIDGYFDHCTNVDGRYDTIFVDGYKAAFDVLIDKI